MNDLFAKSLLYFKHHWHVGMAGSSDAAGLLDINTNTLKTRIARGQALVLRDPDGGLRPTLAFTGFHLVYNLIQDRLLRYGFTVNPDPQGLDHLTYVYSEWALQNVLSEPHLLDSVIRFRKESTGTVQNLIFENGAVEDWTGDAVVILPVGTMVSRLAVSLYMRTAPAAATLYAR